MTPLCNHLVPYSATGCTTTRGELKEAERRVDVEGRLGWMFPQQHITHWAGLC